MMRMMQSGIEDFKITSATSSRPWKGKRASVKAAKKVERPKNAVLPRPGRRISNQTANETDAAICAQILQRQAERRDQRKKEDFAKQRVLEEQEKVAAEQLKNQLVEERRQREIERKGFQMPGLWSDAYSEAWFWQEQ